jgi:hypothetical protein
MTRSRARQNPDQYTMISAQLKIVKVLVEELLSASGGPNAAGATGEDADDDDNDDDGDWEDDNTQFVDLASGMTKSQLMAYAADDAPLYARGRDDETQAYLVNWFRGRTQDPGFAEVFANLSPAEQEKLQTMSE